MSRSVSSFIGILFSTFTILFVGFGSSSFVDQAVAGGDCPLISKTLATRHGMQRQWHTQVPLDPANNRVTHLSLVLKSETSPDTLFVQTERSTLFAIDAETGKMIWSKLVGNPDLVSCKVGCNGQMVAVLNGSSLYLLNRINGRILWSRSFPGVPASGPVLSQRYAYVPLLDGCVVAHPVQKVADDSDSDKKQGDDVQATSAKIASASRLILEQGKLEPLICPSIYRIETQPVLIQNDATADRLAWVNKRGMYVGAINNTGGNEFRLDYSLSTAMSFESSPTFVPSRFIHPDESKRESESAAEEGPFAQNETVKDVPIFGAILVASMSGQVNAIQAGSGSTLWEYHIGQPIVKPVVAIGTRAYVVSQFGLMICFDVQTGKKLWETRDVSQFVAQAKNHLYVLDTSGVNVSTLRVSDGRRIDRLPISGYAKVVCNSKTDRLFLVSPTGLVQSLRQRGVDEPIRH